MYNCILLPLKTMEAVKRKYPLSDFMTSEQAVIPLQRTNKLAKAGDNEISRLQTSSRTSLYNCFNLSRPTVWNGREKSAL